MSGSVEALSRWSRNKTNEISVQVGPETYEELDSSRSGHGINGSLSCMGMVIGGFQRIGKFNEGSRYFPVSTKVRMGDRKAFINRISIQELDNQDTLKTSETKTPTKKTSRCARSSLQKKPNDSTSSKKIIKSQFNSERRLKISSFSSLKVPDPVKEKANIYNPLINFTPSTLAVQYHQPSPKLYSKYLSPYSGYKIKKYGIRQMPSTRSSIVSNTTQKRKLY